MKRSDIMEAPLAKISAEVIRHVDLSFLIFDRIHSILEEKGLKQKDHANILSIEDVPDVPILQVAGVRDPRQTLVADVITV